jgi:hypothetical protein
MHLLLSNQSQNAALLLSRQSQTADQQHRVTKHVPTFLLLVGLSL